jgi:hypothetical protein
VVSELLTLRSGVGSRQGKDGNFLSLLLYPDRLWCRPILLSSGFRGLFPGVKRSWCQADHSPPSSAKAKNAWSCTSSPQYLFMAWCLRMSVIPPFFRKGGWFRIEPGYICTSHHQNVGQNRCIKIAIQFFEIVAKLKNILERQ